MNVRLLQVILFTVLLFPVIHSQIAPSYQISTFLSDVSHPNFLALDSSENLYIADWGNSQIRKMDKSTNADTILVQKISPYGIAINSKGEVFFSDKEKHVVRKLLQNGTVVRVAGTGVSGYSGEGLLAVNSSLSDPCGLAFNSKDELIIADSKNNRIRKLTTDGRLLTIAGTGGNYDLNTPFGVAVTSDDNVYIADSGNYRIRYLQYSSLTTVAGNGISGHSSDGTATSMRIGFPIGLYYSKGVLYFTDSGYNLIRMLSGNNITTLAGQYTSSGYTGDGSVATASKLNYPIGIVATSSGKIFFSDYNNNAVRQLSLTSCTNYYKYSNGTCVCEDFMCQTVSGFPLLYVIIIIGAAVVGLLLISALIGLKLLRSYNYGVKVTPLKIGSRERQEIEQFLGRSWHHQAGVISIFNIYKIDTARHNKRKYKSYKEFIKMQVGADSEQLLFHGTTIKCESLCRNGKLCRKSDCGLCGIIKKGWVIKKAQTKHNWGRFGKGIYFSEVASKSNDYITVNSNLEYRALLIARVTLGKWYRTQDNMDTLENPPSGYHCVYGEPGKVLNYSEHVVYNDDAADVAYVVTYRFN